MGSFFFFFFLPYRPTAAKTLVKNPPSQESTDGGLTVMVEVVEYIAITFHLHVHVYNITLLQEVEHYCNH